jgi:hypothetical protein
MGELGNCRICNDHATVVYPLLPGSPAFCSEHHNPRDAGPFGADFSGPDDFDIPWEDYIPQKPFPLDPTFDSLPFKEQRKIWKWSTKDKRTFKLCRLTDRHIRNIIPYMERRKTEYVLPDEGLRPAWIKRCERTVKLMKQEQAYRQEHHITVEDPPVMKIVHHKAKG